MIITEHLISAAEVTESTVYKQTITAEASEARVNTVDCDVPPNG